MLIVLHIRVGQELDGSSSLGWVGGKVRGSGLQRRDGRHGPLPISPSKSNMRKAPLNRASFRIFLLLGAGRPARRGWRRLIEPFLHRHRNLDVYQQVVAPSVVEHVLPVHLVHGDAGAHPDGPGGPDDVRLPCKPAEAAESLGAEELATDELVGALLAGLVGLLAFQLDAYRAFPVVEDVPELVEERPDDEAVLLPASRLLDYRDAPGGPSGDAVEVEVGAL